MGEYSQIEEEVDFWILMFPKGINRKHKWKKMKSFENVRKELSNEPTKDLMNNPDTTITLTLSYIYTEQHIYWYQVGTTNCINYTVIT